MLRRVNHPGVDLVIELSEYNAPRRCAQCEDDASYYVSTEDVRSAYCCEDHLADEIERAQA